jgi:hypothetical protein
MHHRVAYQDDVPDLLARRACGEQKLAHERPNLSPNEVLKFLQAARGESEFDPAHDVSAVTTLAVQRRPHREYTTALEVQQLGNYRRGAYIHGHSPASPWFKSEGRFVGKYGGVPLAKLNYQIAFNRALAGEPPAARQFLGGKLLALRGVDWSFAFQHLNPASPTTALPSAREFHALFEERIAERSPCGCAQLYASRSKRDSMHHVDGGTGTPACAEAS